MTPGTAGSTPSRQQQQQLSAAHSSSNDDEVEVLCVDEIISPADASDDDSQTMYHQQGFAADFGPSSSGKSSAGGSGEQQKKYVPLLTLDHFARSKVINFIKKNRPSDSSSSPSASLKPSMFSQKAADDSSSAASPFVIEKIQFSRADLGSNKNDSDENGEGDAEYRATIRLPLPEAYGARIAEGLATNQKDAEVAAAMHAERIIDTLGFSLYSLQTSQRRHAEAAAAAGRWAPMPGDLPRGPETASPPPFSFGQLRSSSSSSRSGGHARGVKFSAVFDATFDSVLPSLSSSVALSSPRSSIGPTPFTVDELSVFRVRGFLRAYGQRILRCSRILSRRLSAATPGETSSRGGKCSDEASREFLCQIRLPLDERSFGTRIATGKAEGNKRLAYVLACMHAELIIDTLGLKVFPFDHAMQEQHHRDVIAAGRWCALPLETTLYVDRPSPCPLALVAQHASSTESNHLSAGAALLAELQLKAVDNYHRVQTIHVLDEQAVEDVVAYLSRSLTSSTNLSAATAGFSTIQLGPKQQPMQQVVHRGVFRTTVVVPLALPPSSVEQLVAAGVRGIDELPVQVGTGAATHCFVAMGIAQSQQDSITVCAMHALQCLGFLNIAAYGDDHVKQSACFTRLCAAGGFAVDPTSTRTSALPFLPPTHGLPVPMKLRDRSLAGRIWAAVDPTSPRRSVPSFRDMQDAIVKGRTSHSPLVWDLFDDDDPAIIPKVSDRRILVGPTQAVGRNYIHTVYSPRSPCIRALDRFKDYLERHGQDSERALKVSETQVKCSDGKLRPLFVATAVLPRRHVEKSSSQVKPLEEEDRLFAVGESFLSADDAQVLCAIHAELLIDGCGMELYDHEDLQRQHAETAWNLGRHAAFVWEAHSDGRASPDNVCPPIRREHAGSVRWANSRWQRRPPPSSTTIPQASTATPMVSDAPPGHVPSSSDGKRFADGVTSTASPEVEIDYGNMKAVLKRDINNPKIRQRIEQYLYRFNRSLDDVRRFIEKSPQLGVVYHCQLELPVPIKFGRRVAHGCGSSSGIAFTLCLIHAQSIIDTLQIQLFDSPVAQEKHHRYAVSNNLSPIPPMPGGLAVVAADAPSPPPLKCIDLDVSAPPVPIAPPFITVGEDEAMWQRYVKSVVEFLERQGDFLLRKALASGVLPKSGDGVEEAAMEAAAKVYPGRTATEYVAQVCRERGFDVPDKFWYETVKLPAASSSSLQQGSDSNTNPFPSDDQQHIILFYCKQQVWGTPYFAQGFGLTHNEAANRAALHYSAIILHVCPYARDHGQLDEGSSKPRGGLAQVGRPAMGDEKRQIVELFFVTQPPYTPVSISHRLPPAAQQNSVVTVSAALRRGPSSAASLDSAFGFVTIISFTDDAGLRISEKGKSNVSIEDATVKAFATLYDRLAAGKRSFVALAHALKPFPKIRAATWSRMAKGCSKRWWIDAERCITALAGQQTPTSDSDDGSHLGALKELFFNSPTSPSQMDRDGSNALMPLVSSGLITASNRVTPLGKWVAVVASQLAQLVQATREAGRSPSAKMKGTDSKSILVAASMLVHGAILGHFDAGLTLAACALLAAGGGAVGTKGGAAEPLDLVDLALQFMGPVQKGSSSSSSETGSGISDSAVLFEEHVLSAVSRLKSAIVDAMLSHCRSAESHPCPSTFGTVRGKEEKDSAVDGLGTARMTKNSLIQQFGELRTTNIWPRFSVDLAVKVGGAEVRPSEVRRFDVLSLLAALGYAPLGLLMYAQTRPDHAELDLETSQRVFVSLAEPIGLTVPISKSLAQKFAVQSPKGSSGCLHAAVSYARPESSMLAIGSTPAPTVISPIFPAHRFLATTHNQVKSVGDGELNVFVGEDTFLYFVADDGGEEAKKAVVTLDMLHASFRYHVESCALVPPAVLSLVLRL